MEYKQRATSAREMKYSTTAAFVAPQDKRRDGLRWETRVRMNNNENVSP